MIIVFQRDICMATEQEVMNSRSFFKHEDGNINNDDDHHHLVGGGLDYPLGSCLVHTQTHTDTHRHRHTYRHTHIIHNARTHAHISGVKGSRVCLTWIWLSGFRGIPSPKTPYGSTMTHFQGMKEFLILILDRCKACGKESALNIIHLN